MAIVVVGGGAGKESPKPAEIVKKVEPTPSNNGGTGLVILSEVQRRDKKPGMAEDMGMGIRQALGEGEIVVVGDPLMDLGGAYADGVIGLAKGAVNTVKNTVKGGTAVLRVGVNAAIEEKASGAQRIGFQEGGLAGLVGATIVQESVKGIVGMIARRNEKKKNK